MPTVLDDSDLSASRLRQAFAYWRGKLAGRAMPARRDIDPVEMPTLLPYVMLVDVLPAPLDFRYRLIGAEVRAILKHNCTGKRFSEMPGKGRDSVVWGNCEQVVLTKAPFSRSPPYVGPELHLSPLREPASAAVRERVGRDYDSTGDQLRARACLRPSPAAGHD